MMKNNLSSVRTLCLITRPEHLLLGLKKRGFGVGLWNGFGGKVEAEESVEAAAVREVREEAELMVSSLEKRGILTFTFESGSDPLEVHVFAVLAYTGEPQETEEMRPQWFSYRTIPYDEMWADDRYWLPLFLLGRNFQGTFSFKDTATLLRHRLEEVVFLP